MRGRVGGRRGREEGGREGGWEGGWEVGRGREARRDFLCLSMGQSFQQSKHPNLRTAPEPRNHPRDAPDEYRGRAGCTETDRQRACVYQEANTYLRIWRCQSSWFPLMKFAKEVLGVPSQSRILFRV